MHFKMFENAFTGGLTYILHKYPGIPVYMKFSVFYVVDVFIIFQHIIQPLKIKKVVDA